MSARAFFRSARTRPTFASISISGIGQASKPQGSPWGLLLFAALRKQRYTHNGVVHGACPELLAGLDVVSGAYS